MGRAPSRPPTRSPGPNVVAVVAVVAAAIVVASLLVAAAVLLIAAYPVALIPAGAVVCWPLVDRVRQCGCGPGGPGGLGGPGGPGYGRDVWR